jgi:hypothetical protein
VYKYIWVSNSSGSSVFPISVLSGTTCQWILHFSDFVQILFLFEEVAQEGGVHLAFLAKRVHSLVAASVRARQKQLCKQGRLPASLWHTEHTRVRDGILTT